MNKSQSYKEKRIKEIRATWNRFLKGRTDGRFEYKGEGDNWLSMLDREKLLTEVLTLI